MLCVVEKKLIHSKSTFYLWGESPCSKSLSVCRILHFKSSLKKQNIPEKTCTLAERLQRWRSEGFKVLDSVTMLKGKEASSNWQYFKTVKAFFLDTDFSDAPTLRFISFFISTVCLFEYCVSFAQFSMCASYYKSDYQSFRIERHIKCHDSFSCSWCQMLQEKQEADVSAWFWPWNLFIHNVTCKNT